MPKPVSNSQILKKRARKQQRSLWVRIVCGSLWAVLGLTLLSAVGCVGLVFYMARDLPKISSLKDYHPSIITTVFSDDHRKIAEFYRERRIVVPLEQIPLQLQQAFIAAEDARFYKHQGVDIVSIGRAFLKNLEAGTIVQGGSTITQQVTKSFLLTPERSYERKIKEALLAYQIDKAFTKDEILYLYLNQIYLGHGAYGVEAAAENYFGKPAKDLNLAECAVLAGLPQAPSRYSPFHYPERAKQRQIYVLNRMVDEGFISQIEASEAITFEMDIKPRRNWYLEKVPVYTEHVRRYVEKQYGEEALYTQGLKIHAAVNIEMQKAAREQIGKGLEELDHRQGYRGPLKQLSPEQIEAYCQNLQAKFEETPLAPQASVNGVVIDVDDKAGRVTVRMGNHRGVIALKDMRWARKPNPDVPYYAAQLRRASQALAPGDVIWVKLLEKDEKADQWKLQLDQVPEVQAALMCIEAGTGLVKVMLGGRDFMESQFNRAIQSRRQPGSAFKPIIYAAALDKGYTPATVIIDSPIVFQDETHDFTWKPRNYGKKFYGATLLREALAKSRNVVTIKIMQDIGIDYVIDYARKLGIESDLSHDLSIALGSSGISLLETVQAYSVFANQGYLVTPAFVTKIEDRHGNILEEMNPARQKVLEKSTAYIMTSLLEGVVKYGTGKRIRDLKRPVAGKTGTTNNLYDAWFVGYTPRFITGVWVGYDQERSLGAGETGSRAASPIWLGFMKQILKNEPVRIFQVPEGVVFAKIDAETGLLPIPESKKTLFECFKEGTMPQKTTPKPGTITEPEQFFKKDM
ncbi:MAG: PBP1A family penicillin-binding protein [Desulfatitalea sp.]|nr:PBP1A family penicillin-binding protein [Desulfatitalea sp.]NNK02798.1 PBP1A family penicillin-binding protein [Desulfatitalea sp.]